MISSLCAYERMGRPSKKRLLEDDGNDGALDGDSFGFKVNEEYARRFEHNNKRADLHRLQELEKSGAAGDDSDSPSEEEDEDGVLPEQIEEKIFETLARIKARDPAIYKEDVKFFDEADVEGGEQEKASKKGEEGGKKRPVYLKDLVGQQLLEDEVEDVEEHGRPAGRGKTYVEEQEELRQAFTGIADGGDADDDDDEDATGGLLKVRKRSREEKAREREEEAQAVAEAEAREAKAGSTIEAKLEEYFGYDDALDDSDKFLKRYLLRQGWIDKDRDRVPTYDEVVGDVDESEEEIERQERFEAGFNFRYEEPGSTHVAGHSRSVEGSVRKKSEARKTQRRSKEERMEAEALARREELKRLKNLKRRELQERLARIRQVAGAPAAPGALAALEAEDLEVDFEPEEYDRKMRAAFGESYYDMPDEEFEGNEVLDEEELEKPDFDAEDAALGLTPGWWAGGGAGGADSAANAGVGGKGSGGKGGGFLTLREKDKRRKRGVGAAVEDEDGGDGEGGDEEGEGEEGEGRGESEDDEEEEEEGEGAGEGDEEEEEEEEEEEAGKKKKKRGRISLRDKMAFDKRLEEYYKLDYEDMVGDLPTRFKYTEVRPNTFGLDTEDILEMDDAELNQVVSIKKLAPYRTDEWEPAKWQRHALSKKQRKRQAMDFHGDGGSLAEAGAGAGAKKRKRSGKEERGGREKKQEGGTQKPADEKMKKKKKVKAVGQDGEQGQEGRRPQEDVDMGEGDGPHNGAAYEEKKEKKEKANKKKNKQESATNSNGQEHAGGGGASQASRGGEEHAANGGAEKRKPAQDSVAVKRPDKKSVAPAPAGAAANGTPAGPRPKPAAISGGGAQGSQGLSKAAKKNLQRRKKAKEKSEGGGSQAALSLSRLQSYGEAAVPEHQRKKGKKKKLRGGPRRTQVD